MPRVAGAALVSALALGVQQAFRPRQPVPVVVEHPGDPVQLDHPVTLFFHPSVPEATLVLVSGAG